MTGEKATSSKVPRLRFQEFQNEWKDMAFGTLIERVGVLVEVDPVKSYQEIGIRSHGKGVFHKELITGKDLGNKRVFWIEENTLILNIVFAWEQAIAITSKAETGMIGSHRFPMYRPLTEKANLMYLLKYFLTKNGKKILELASPGGAGRNKTLGQKLFENSILTVPHVLEQEKIALFLIEIDRKIEKLKLKKSLLEKYKGGVMQKIFSQEIKFKNADGKIFPEWRKRKLGEMEDSKIIKLGRGDVISKIDTKSFPGNYPIYSSSVHNKGLFAKFGKYMFDEELISWSIDGGGNFFYRSKHKFSITNVSGWLRIIDIEYLDCKFLALQLEYLHKKEFFDYQTKAHPSIIRELYYINLPSLPEQQKIASFLSEIDGKIEAITVEIESTEKWKKGLLQGMFI